MRRALGVLVAVVVLVVMATGCEPSMTITAKPSATQVPACSIVQATGNVSPVGATSKVVLQLLSEQGKWEDFVAPSTLGSDNYTLRTANVSKRTGGYAINFMYVWYSRAAFFRVRSNGSTAVSPQFYVSVKGSVPGC